MKKENDITKVAVTEDGRLVELYVEREEDGRVVGNIYKGVVKNILPGMQSAFVDIGLEKNAFLYVSDARTTKSDEASGIEGLEVPIQDLLKVGQEVMVQISKEPVGTKGARITEQITLPGRYLVLMPTVDYVTCSRQIPEGKERERLIDIARRIKPEGQGLIVRTVGEGISEEELTADRDNLLALWKTIEHNFNHGGPLGLVYQDLALSERILRDIFSTDVNRLWVNSRQLYNQVCSYVEVMEPRLKGKVFVCNMEELFDKYSVDQELSQALNRKVWMKNGSYLVFDHTEALTVIDVNTGKYVGTRDLDDTVLRTNIEAAKEIARQLRVRNVGGIVIIDFIDMNEEGNKQKVLNALEEELAKDKVHSKVMGITSLGLVEVTRKKVRQSLDSTLEKTCPCCGGKGRVPIEYDVPNE